MSQQPTNFKLLDFNNVNRAKYEYQEPQRVNAKCLVSTCIYNLDNKNKFPYFFETIKLRTLTEIYKLGNEFKLDVVVPMSSPFMEYLIAEDEKNVKVTVDNSVEWFGSQISHELAQEKYKSCIIFRSGGEDPILRLNIPAYRGKPTVEVYDANRRLVEYSRIQPGCEIACIVEKVGIRFQQQTFCGDLDCHKIKITQVSEAPKLPTGYFFQDEHQAEDEEEGSDLEFSGEEDGEEEEELNLDSSDGEELEGEENEESGESDGEVDLGEIEGLEDVGIGADSELGGEEEELDGETYGEQPGFEVDELTDEELELSEDESEDESGSEEGGDSLDETELEIGDLGLEEVTMSDGEHEEPESEDEDLGLEELDLSGGHGHSHSHTHEEPESDIENELGLQEMDMTPSRRQQQVPTHGGLQIEELTDDELEGW
jgi:hypothetical protein